MGVKVVTTEPLGGTRGISVDTGDRLTLRLPDEGQTWIRQGGEMVGWPLAGARANSLDEVITADGPIAAGKAHTDLAMAPGGRLVATLGAAGLDGIVKSLRIVGDPTGIAVTVTGAFREGGAARDTLTFSEPGQGVLLVWQGSSTSWIVRLTSGDVLVTLGPPT